MMEINLKICSQQIGIKVTEQQVQSIAIFADGYERIHIIVKSYTELKFCL